MVIHLPLLFSVVLLSCPQQTPHQDFLAVEWIHLSRIVQMVIIVTTGGERAALDDQALATAQLLVSLRA